MTVTINWNPESPAPLSELDRERQLLAYHVEMARHISTMAAINGLARFADGIAEHAMGDDAEGTESVQLATEAIEAGADLAKWVADMDEAMRERDGDTVEALRERVAPIMERMDKETGR